MAFPPQIDDSEVKGEILNIHSFLVIDYSFKDSFNIIFKEDLTIVATAINN